MRKKANPMKYFSGSVVDRLPLHKVIAGGLAVLMTASIGIGAMAATFAGTEPQEPAPVATPEPTPVPTPEPTPEPTPTPMPKEILAEVTVVQQDVGVQLYYIDPNLTDAEEPEAPETEEKDGLTEDRLPFTGLEATVILTNENEEATEYEIDTETGVVLIEDVEPGEYVVTVAPVEGFVLPEPQTVTVDEKVAYVADTAGIADKIVQAADVAENQEDSSYGNGGGAPIADELTDTVEYADSKVEEGERKTVYTAPLSSDGYLLLKEGGTSPYKPVYNDKGELTGAKRAAAAGAKPAALFGSGLKIVNINENPDPEATDEPDQVPTPEPTAEPTPEPTLEPTPGPTATPTAKPTAEPTATPTAKPTAEPTATPTVEPTAAPTATPTATPAPEDPTASWPNEIKASKMSKYFQVTSEEKITYIYTGWQEIDGKTYYYNPANHKPVTGTQVILGVMYTFGSDGALTSTTRGIDVSKYQNNIDWNAVAAAGYSFAIIRVGYRGYGSGALVEDSAFRRNIAGAKAAGLRVGVYFYTQAVNEAEAVEEASMVLRLCSGYSLPMGVWYDTEKVAGATGRGDTISAAQRTACAVAFCETIRNGGYTPGVYSYASWFYNNLNFANVSKYRTWIAQYRDKLDFKYKYDIWQYTGSGHVSGVPTEVDMNISYTM